MDVGLRPRLTQWIVGGGGCAACGGFVVASVLRTLRSSTRKAEVQPAVLLLHLGCPHGLLLPVYRDSGDDVVGCVVAALVDPVDLLGDPAAFPPHVVAFGLTVLGSAAVLVCIQGDSPSVECDVV